MAHVAAKLARDQSYFTQRFVTNCLYGGIFRHEEEVFRNAHSLHGMRKYLSFCLHIRGNIMFTWCLYGVTSEHFQSLLTNVKCIFCLVQGSWDALPSATLSLRPANYSVAWVSRKTADTNEANFLLSLWQILINTISYCVCVVQAVNTSRTYLYLFRSMCCSSFLCEAISKTHFGNLWWRHMTSRLAYSKICI